MRTRSCFVLAALAVLALCPVASADSSDPRASSPRVAEYSDDQEDLDRALERAMVGLDRKLESILGSTTMNCSSEGSIDRNGGLETCVATLDFEQGDSRL